uniref:Integral membrane protein 2 n=1 Tax=Zosterops lateralis melanops TaxID=1220523 RepID=A0A8D2NN34_ZOSLA
MCSHLHLTWKCCDSPRVAPPSHKALSQVRTRLLVEALGTFLPMFAVAVGGVCVVPLPGLSPQLPHESVFHCGVLYEDSLYSPFKGQLELHEDVKIYIEENYEQINVPVPQFGGSDPADIIHDFQRGLTAYHDITLDKCYVIELNTTIVMPPRNLWDLSFQKGTYLPQTYIIQEEMIATEHVSDMEQLGSFIYRLCSGKETYRLRRRNQIMLRREAGNCHCIRHFENTFVVETVICQKS